MELYKPGTYCKGIDCPEYHNGKFSPACDDCGAYQYYLWLQKNDYQIVKRANNRLHLTAFGASAQALWAKFLAFSKSLLARIGGK